MKKTGKQLLAALLAACMLAPLCGCEEKIRVDVHLTYDGERDVLVNPAADCAYTWASVSYEPAYVGEPYADWDKTLLYQVKGWEPDTLLTEEFSGVGGLLYNENYALPTLGEMNADTIYVCVGETSTSCIYLIEDKDTVARAAELMETGETVELPGDGVLTMSLKFTSPDYEGIYYSILYIEMGEEIEDDRYLYDRGTKRCVKIEDDLFLGTLYGGEEPELPENAGGTVDENGDVIFNFDAQNT